MLIAVLAAALFAGAYLLVGRSADDDRRAAGEVSEGAPIVSVSIPETLSDAAVTGARAFEAKCSACHGASAAGKQGFGPPLVHRVYEPGHHGDMAFQLAVRNGVRGHHWKFGDMPPVAGLSVSEVDTIVAYVRELQRANGIR